MSPPSPAEPSEGRRSQSPLCTVALPSGENVPIWRRSFGGPGPRVAVIAGVRGDTPEGIRVAHVVARELDKVAERLLGGVDVYPAINPLAAHHGARNWPAFDVDLNRRFPGRSDGHVPDRVTAALTAALEGCLAVVELRGAHPAFREDTQAHVREDCPQAAELAVHTNVAVVWRRGPELESGTLSQEIPGLIRLEGGTGNRLTEGVGQALSDGVLNLLMMLGVLPEDCLPFHWAAISRPRTVTDRDVHRVRALRGGLFLPEGSIGGKVKEGAVLGEVVDPFSGERREVLTAPVGGRLLAVREQPVCYPGSLVARMVGE